MEVLSPSTSATDRAEKLEKYFRLPSVQHYLIVWADRRRVVHHRRDGGSVATTVHTEGSYRGRGAGCGECGRRAKLRERANVIFYEELGMLGVA